MMSRLRRTTLVAGMLLACGPLGATPGAAAGPLAAPYPRSKVVTGISWDASTYRFAGLGGDLWATTSGADGKVYTTWGDGTVACPVRVSFGVASVAGGPGTTPWSGPAAAPPATRRTSSSRSWPSIQLSTPSPTCSC